MIEAFSALADMNMWVFGGLFLVLLWAVVWASGLVWEAQYIILSMFVSLWVFINTLDFGSFVITIVVLIVGLPTILIIITKIQQDRIRGKITFLPSKH